MISEFLSFVLWFYGEGRLTRNSAMSPKDLTTEGSNVESKVLATAVKWVTEKRVLLNGHKTIVFN